YEALKDLLDHRRETAPDSPVHIHVAEQAREINECMLATGKRPVEWLLDSMDVDQSWCLIHATHISDSEMSGIVQSGATVGLCPTTEADLGDGHFPFEKYVGLSGSWAIGSDSNTSVSPVEEVRLLDYTSRLLQRRRNVFQFDGSLGSGTRLYQRACEGGRLASALPVGRIEPESHADFVALSTSHALTDGLSADEVLNSYIYAGGRDLIDQVFVAGNPQL
ncbi:MAG: amidohydrolase family protein, partial [Gemmatimonadetes bacterium]|nr:amidohydrolase family protein [Gemmatimonadota bacterium]